MVLEKLKMRKQEQGFTLVELLIVIVVIAILAAITIVAYGNVTSKAHDSGYASDAGSIASLFETYNADNGNYPSASNVSSGSLPSTGTAKQPSGIKINSLNSTTGTTAVAPTGSSSTMLATSSCSTASTVWALCDDNSGTKYYSVYYCAATSGGTATGAVIYYVKTTGGNTLQHVTAGGGC